MSDAMSTTYETDMLEPLAIGSCTLNAEVSENSRTRMRSGVSGRNSARGSSRQNVSVPTAMTERMYPRPRRGRSRSKTPQYTFFAAGAFVKQLFDTIVYRMRKKLVVLLLAAAGGAGAWYYARSRPAALVLTGIVTTNDVIVSPQIAGQIDQLLVNEGETVRKDQLVAVIAPDALKADTAYYSHTVAGLTSQVRESEAARRYQQRQTADQIRQAESTVASTEAQVAAAAADLENSRLTFARTEDLSRRGVVSPQELDQARTAFNAAQAKL